MLPSASTGTSLAWCGSHSIHISELYGHTMTRSSSQASSTEPSSSSNTHAEYCGSGTQHFANRAPSYPGASYSSMTSRSQTTPLGLANTSRSTSCGDGVAAAAVESSAVGPRVGAAGAVGLATGAVSVPAGDASSVPAQPTSRMRVPTSTRALRFAPPKSITLPHRPPRA